MNRKITFDQNLLRILYFRNKQYLVPICTILVCIFVFWRILLPQLFSWFATRDTITADRQTLAVLQQNIQLMTNLDETTLNTWLKTTATALPAEKDFAGILNAVSNAAALSGTSLGDYNFQIGNLSSNLDVGQKIFLQISLSLNGGMTQVEKFLVELKKQLPISDITEVDVHSTVSSTVVANFYYFPFPKITFNDTVPIETISKQQQDLITALAGEESPDFSALENSTPSALRSTVTPTPANTTPTVTPTPANTTPTVTPTPSATPMPTFVPTLTPTVVPTQAATSSSSLIML